jgi:chromosome segregation ATPase
MPESPTRARLSEINAILETAKRELAQAEVLAKRAAKELATAKAAFQNSVTVKHDVLQWRISALKANSTDPMPADLVEARRESASAQEDLEHSEAVLSHLNLEYEAAQENLKSAEREKVAAVNAVVLEEAKALVSELTSVNERRHHLRLVLRGLTLHSATPQNYTLAQNLINSGLQDDDRQLPMSHSPIQKASAYWRSFSDALVSSADAKPGDYPTLESLWS